MATKPMMLCPIYWGDWWVPARQNAYNWAEVDVLEAGLRLARR
jgi:hypothetical protein